MFVESLKNALIFTIHTVFNLYISIILLRFMLDLVRADFYNPVSQLVLKLTNPVLAPFRKMRGKHKGTAWILICAALALQAVELVLTLGIEGFWFIPSLTSIGGLITWSFGEVLDLWLTLMLLLVFVRVLFSWLQQGGYHPFAAMLGQVTSVLFRPVRRLVPDIGVIDLSPMIVIFAIIILRMICSGPIISLGRSLI